LKFGVRGKLFLLSAGLVLLATSFAFFYIRRDLEQRTLVEVESSLRMRAVLMAGRATELRLRSSYHEGLALESLHRIWQPLTIQMGREAKCRVTIIRRDGFVLGDSDLTESQLSTLENHALRPEVRDAFTSGSGVSRRLSSTISSGLLYYAVPFPSSIASYGVVRASVELSQIDAAVASLRRSLAYGALSALALSLLVSLIAAQFASRAARSLTLAARRMAAGDLNTGIPQLSKDEFGELGNALDQLARGLSQTLRELKSERDRMDGVLSRMHEGVLMLDATGHIVLVNPALREMLLLQNALGKTPLEAIRHSELKLLLDEVVAKDRAASREIEVAGLMPRRLLVRAAPLGADEGGVFAVFFDVTEMRRLETLRRDFIANVSHELRTPVTAIRSAGETIRDIAINDPQVLPRFVDIIVRNAERLGSLVDDILELSRIESRALRLVLEPIDTISMLSQAASLFHERAERKGLDLQVVTEEVGQVVADRRAFENVVTNLIDNAVKYCGTGAAIRVGAHAESDVVRIVVEDTGPGIDPSHHSRLFERFYRVDTGRSRELGGTGLGLSIVKHLVEAMGSQIRVESTPGVGSRFFFSLPRADKYEDMNSKSVIGTKALSYGSKS
jgi:two-component system, OmpR family, phosphate regulon sensor histidine kinase PhoR